MKIMIVSDSHATHDFIDLAWGQMQKQVGEIDIFIHLGDFVIGLKDIEEIINCEKYIIAGNSDFFSDLPKELEFFIGSRKVFITHGHQFETNWGGVDTDELIEAGRSREADIIMFGHTHMPLLEILPDITLLNPGSISNPRQLDKRHSFMLMEIDSDNKAKYSTYYFNSDGQFVCL